MSDQEFARTCRYCGKKDCDYRRLRMENESKHLMYYITLPLCDECGWALRDKIRETVRSFFATVAETPKASVPEESAKVKEGEEDEECNFGDFEIP